MIALRRFLPVLNSLAFINRPRVQKLNRRVLDGLFAGSRYDLNMVDRRARVVDITVRSRPIKRTGM